MMRQQFVTYTKTSLPKVYRPIEIRIAKICTYLIGSSRVYLRNAIKLLASTGSELSQPQFVAEREDTFSSSSRDSSQSEAAGSSRGGNAWNDLGTESTSSDGPAVSASRGGEGRDSFEWGSEKPSAPREMPVPDEGPSVDEIIKVSLPNFYLAPMRAYRESLSGQYRQSRDSVCVSSNVTRV